MVRRTYSSRILVSNTTATKLLDENPNRIGYSIQNQDANNSIFVSPFASVTAGTGTASDGQEIVASGYVSDDMDQSEVFAIAENAAVSIVVQETVEYRGRRPGKTEIPIDNIKGRRTARMASRVM